MITLIIGAIMVGLGLVLATWSSHLREKHRNSLQEDLPYEVWLEGMDLYDPLPKNHWLRKHTANILIVLGVALMTYYLIT